ncbi:dihydrofolate reductase [Bacillus salipaludis]|uniref:Dihydrofolate reductase n=1 Tax=Bacillus salipaludis TaxID=2547811 RepID=A0A4R5VIV5_9BACI|nr:dihydrofolate reductase family protein [Bacillus salipaludis]MDQ6597727.1 dihydrofolate reductase family protein [Bacillus salipaludis]TDK56333.1 dihydrofolate reductase [Bacillus salipaludis]
MAKLIYHIAITLDNFIADLNGVADDSIFLNQGDHFTDFISDIQQYDAVLMGGKTYEYGFQFGLKPGEPSPYKLKHYIFSNTMQFESNDEVKLIKNNAVSFIQDLKMKEDGKLWLCGGGKLAGSLIQHKLIDQLVLKVNPVMIGTGIPLFGSVKPRLNMELVDMQQYSNGVLKSTYNIIYS